MALGCDYEVYLQYPKKSNSSKKHVEPVLPSCSSDQ